MKEFVIKKCVIKNAMTVNTDSTDSLLTEIYMDQLFNALTFKQLEMQGSCERQVNAIRGLSVITIYIALTFRKIP